MAATSTSIAPSRDKRHCCIRAADRTALLRSASACHIAVLLVGAWRQPQRRPHSTSQEGARSQRLSVITDSDRVLRWLLPDGTAGRLDHEAAGLSQGHAHRPEPVRARHIALPARSNGALVSLLSARAVRNGVRAVRARGRRESVRHRAWPDGERRTPIEHRTGIQRTRRVHHTDHRCAIHSLRRRALEG